MENTVSPIFRRKLQIETVINNQIIIHPETMYFPSPLRERVRVGVNKLWNILTIYPLTLTVAAQHNR